MPVDLIGRPCLHKSMGKTATYLLLVLLTIVTAFGLWLGHFVWPQKDYASEGLCTVEQIDRTSAAIDAMNGWRDATIARVNAEAGVRSLQTLESAIARSVNMQVDMRFARRHTAAFSCGHAYVRFSIGRPITLLPQAVDRLEAAGMATKDAWTTAQCLSYRRYSPAYSSGYAEADIEGLRTLCRMRALASLRVG